MAGTAQTDTEFYFCKGVALIAWALLLPDAVSAGDDFQAPEEISFDLHSNILQRDAQSSGALMYHMNTGLADSGLCRGFTRCSASTSGLAAQYLADVPHPHSIPLCGQVECKDGKLPVQECAAAMGFGGLLGGEGFGV